MNVANKTIIVTGAGSGIGRALSQELISKGATIIGVDLHENALLETKSLLGESNTKFYTEVLNIADKSAVQAFPELLFSKQFTVDGLINNAGIIQPFVKINDLTDADIERVMHVNFYGALYLTKAFLPHFLSRPEAHIVNISSMGGFLPVPGQAIYGASKAAVKLFTEGLYAELLNTNIRVTVIFPGAVATNITQNSGLELPTENAKETANFPMQNPKKVAQKIIQAMEKNKFSLCVGKDSKMMNLLYRLNPKFATRLIAKKMASLLK